MPCIAVLPNLSYTLQMNVDDLVRTLPAAPSDYSWAWSMELSPSKPLNVRVIAALTAVAYEPPNEDEIILWFGAPSAGSWSDLLVGLSTDEAARASKFRLEADRWSYAAAHAALRSLLGSMLACAPLLLRFVVDSNGKPLLNFDGLDPAIQFSVSHARGCVAIALARRRVGVDVEQRRELKSLMAIARSAFATEAYETLADFSEAARRNALFYRYWTLGEAFIKATGKGFAQDPKTFCFNSQGRPTLTRVSADWGPVSRWRFDCAA